MSEDCRESRPDPPVELSFFMPSNQLRPYISSFYMMDVKLAEAQRIEDWLLPEWASLRMAQTGDAAAAIVPQPLQPRAGMMASGPTSSATRITIGSARIWGVGLLPLGWDRFVAAPAADYADRISDAATEPAWRALSPIFDLAFADQPCPLTCRSPRESCCIAQWRLDKNACDIFLTRAYCVTKGGRLASKAAYKRHAAAVISRSRRAE